MMKHKHSENINLPVFHSSNSFDDLWWSKKLFPTRCSEGHTMSDQHCRRSGNSNAIQENAHTRIHTM